MPRPAAFPAASDRQVAGPAKRDRVPSGLLLAVAMTGFQGSSALAVKGFPIAGPLGTTFARLALAALMLSALLRPRLGQLHRRELAICACFGASIAGILLGGAEALARMPLGIVVTVMALGPLAVSVATKRKRSDGLWSGLALVGVLLMTKPWTGTTSTGGLAFAAMAAGCWAAYILIGARLNRTVESRTALAPALTVAALVASVPGILQGGSSLMNGRLLLIAVACAAVGNVLTYMLELEALRRMPTAVFGICMGFEPAFAVMWGFVLLGQSLTVGELAGIACVIAAAALANRPNQIPA